MDCDRCKELYERLNSLPPCDDCTYPGLMPVNLPAYKIWMTAAPVAYDGMGGVNLHNVRLVAETLGYGWDYDLMMRLIVAMTTAREAVNGKRQSPD